MMIDRRALGLSTLAAGLAFSASVRAKPKAFVSEPLSLKARSPYLQWEGRGADIKDGTVRAGFPGVVLRIRFNASKLVLKTAASSDNVYLDIAIDGAAPQMIHLAPGTQDLTVFTGASGEHSVEITRRNESWQGVWDVSDATIDSGRFLTPAPLPAKKIMLIGDSITCGEACDVARDDTRNDIAFADAHKSYGMVLARRLGTQCHLVACGGRGLTRDWQGIRSGVNAPQFYERAAPDEASPLWDHNSYVPDAIGICLGTNDFSQGIPDQTDFVSTYVEFVEKIHRDAASAHIFLMDSPIVTDGDQPKRTVLGSYIGEVVKRLGSPLVSHAPVGHYPGRPANGHPIAEEHIAIAGELEPLFRAALEKS